MDKLIITERWLKKSKQYGSELDESMDKFFSLYVAYNAFFSMHTNKKGDRAGATTGMAKYLEKHQITILNELKDEVHKMMKPVEDKRFKIYGEDKKDDNQKDSFIIGKIKEDINNYKAVLNFIYGIRCNMFHGDKLLIIEQVDLLTPANNILEKLLEACLEHEKKETL